MATNPKPEHYVLSDLHLGHENILGFCRPWFSNIEHHDSFIIEQINATVKPGELLWLLGDIAFSKQALHRLSDVKCDLALIGGNHDTYSPERYLKYFKQIRGVAQMSAKEYPFAVFTHIPMHPDQKRWELNIHGHLHTYHVNDDRYINVSCEPMNFTPKKIGELINEKRRDREDN